MLLIRRLLQIVFGLVILAVVVMMVTSPTADLVTDAVFIVFFVFIILVLGPWWPGPHNARKWDWALKVKLPTDDPKVAAPLASAAMGIYSLFHAWGHMQPNPQFHGYEKIIAPWSSHEGVALAWAIISVSCFVGAWQAFRRVQMKPKKVL